MAAGCSLFVYWFPCIYMEVLRVDMYCVSVRPWLNINPEHYVDICMDQSKHHCFSTNPTLPNEQQSYCHLTNCLTCSDLKSDWHYELNLLPLFPFSPSNKKLEWWCLLLTEVHSDKQNEGEAATWFPFGNFHSDGPVSGVSVSTCCICILHYLRCTGCVFCLFCSVHFAVSKK